MEEASLTAVIIKWAQPDSLADLLGIISPVASFVLFLFAFRKAKAAAAAAESINKEVKLAIKKMNSIDSTIKLSSMIRELNDIQKLQRERNWRSALDRYHPVIESLTVCAKSDKSLTDNQSRSLENCAEEMIKLERYLSKHVYNQQEPKSINRILTVVPNCLKEVSAVLAHKKAEGG